MIRYRSGQIEGQNDKILCMETGDLDFKPAGIPNEKAQTAKDEDGCALVGSADCCSETSLDLTR